MIRKYFRLICIAVLAVTLTLILSGCGKEEQSLEGKNIVTFELNGGMLNVKTSTVENKVNFAYTPGTYILDPTEIPGYKLSREEDGIKYNFTGWYTSPDCNANEKWNFKTPFNTETLTLYAGWEKAIKYTYTVYYVENGESKALGSYDVKVGEKFDDFKLYANARKGYTFTEVYYSDMSLTTAWDDSFAHPGGETDNDIAVYVDHIEGEWALVDTYDKLNSAIKSGKNVYLTADIDCGGNELVDRTVVTSYKGIFEGNGHNVSNVTVKKDGNYIVTIAIFAELGLGAEIRNVNFTSVAYDLTELGSTVTSVEAAALSVSVQMPKTPEEASKTVKITNVSVSGTLTTNYEGDLSHINDAVYEIGEGANIEITNFVSNITVTVQ